MKYQHIIRWPGSQQKHDWLVGLLRISEGIGELRYLESAGDGAMFRTDVMPLKGFLDDFFQSDPDIEFTHEYASESMLEYVRHTYCGGCLTEVFHSDDAEEINRCARMVWDQAPKIACLSPFEEKIERRWQEYLQNMLEYPKAGLVDKADEIAAVKKVRETLLSPELDGGIREYLDRFENPLEVASDRVLNEQDGGISAELRHVFWELCDKRDAEQDYELEPEYREQEQSM